ncbi:MAG TPA: M14 family zinc carboxypeptidase [Anaerolineales bacterium]|nr:M14 family zinc carboxypeptidase [Anaerolineales bacterium]
MPAPSRRKDSPWILAAWTINILGGLSLLTVIIVYWAGRPAKGSQTNPGDPQATPYPTLTMVPTRYYLPSVTPNPLSTSVLEATATPFYLADGTKPTVVGFSAEGRPLEVYTFGQGEKRDLIIGGIHGGYEWNTIALADQLIAYVNGNLDVIPSDVTLYILPDMNPDGDARSHDVWGRVNANGVDLNRNFPVGWTATWNRDGCYDLSITTSGSGPGSEPETRLVMSFIASHRLQAVINYHSAALGISPGGTPWDAASIRLARALAAVTTYPFPPINTGCVFSGTLPDFAVSQGAAAVDMELTNHQDTDFSMNLRALNVLLNFTK